MAIHVAKEVLTYMVEKEGSESHEKRQKNQGFPDAIDETSLGRIQVPISSN